VYSTLSLPLHRHRLKLNRLARVLFLVGVGLATFNLPYASTHVTNITDAREMLTFLLCIQQRLDNQFLLNSADIHEGAPSALFILYLPRILEIVSTILL
jgi:hypothetical protein